MSSFVRTVVLNVTWRAVLLSQSLGLLFAVTPWLEHWHNRSGDHLLVNLVQQAPTAAFVMLAGFAGDEAVRRGWTVWRAFVVGLLGASVATALVELSIWQLVQVHDPYRVLLRTVTTFFDVGAVWGMVLLVYLNRQSAARLLSRVRGGELDRAQAERRVIASGLAAVEVQMDPAEVSRQLLTVRNLYAAEAPGAESAMEALINDLRERVARCESVP